MPTSVRDWDSGVNLERDLVTMKTLADEYGTEAGIVDAWKMNSSYRQKWVLRELHTLLLSKKQNPVIAIWGLAYKPNTQSIKNSPSLALIKDLASFTKIVFDPQAKLDPKDYSQLQQATAALDACHQADGLIVMTPWDEFAKIEPSKIKQAMIGNLVIDPLGILNRQECLKAGLSYHKLGVSS